MSLYGMLRASVSGLNAQSAKLGSIASNIANAGTTGYKKSSTEFSSLILNTAGGAGSRGGVIAHTSHEVRAQGALNFTTSSTDLAISGRGFFVVQGSNGESFLTRAGAFVPNAEGQLVNTAGFALMGRAINSGDTATVVNSPAELEPITLSTLSLQANPTTTGNLRVNLPSQADIVAAADLPSANAASATYTEATSLVAYDNLGGEVIVDVYYSKTAAGEWEVAVFNRADAATGGGFPYSSGPITTANLSFDPSNGNLTTASPKDVDIPIPGGQTVKLDLSLSTQLASDYAVVEATVNGNAPSDVARVEFSDDGTLYAIYENGAAVATHRLPIADVPSPDSLTNISGNIFALNGDSGALQLGFPQDSGLGTLVDGALEQSTVDLATELTEMIEAQRNYTANSKAFQTGSELLDVLVNLKR